MMHVRRALLQAVGLEMELRAGIPAPMNRANSVPGIQLSSFKFRHDRTSGKRKSCAAVV